MKHLNQTRKTISNTAIKFKLKNINCCWLLKATIFLFKIYLTYSVLKSFKNNSDYRVGSCASGKLRLIQAAGKLTNTRTY